MSHRRGRAAGAGARAALDGGGRAPLHPEKTQLVDLQQPGGFDFLGYHFERRLSLAAQEEPAEAQGRGASEDPTHQRAEPRGHHRRTSIARSRGWFGYFKHSHAAASTPLDAWIRMRLRSILRKRAGDRGRGRAGGPSALARSLLCGARAVFLGTRPMRCPSVLCAGDSSTGEPDAGDPPVRFGGRGERTQSLLPTMTDVVLRMTSAVFVRHCWLLIFVSSPLSPVLSPYRRRRSRLTAATFAGFFSISLSSIVGRYRRGRHAIVLRHT